MISILDCLRINGRSNTNLNLKIKINFEIGPESIDCAFAPSVIGIMETPYLQSIQ